MIRAKALLLRSGPRATGMRSIVAMSYAGGLENAPARCRSRGAFAPTDAPIGTQGGDLNASREARVVAWFEEHMPPARRR
jgi:hypothetical protein